MSDPSAGNPPPRPPRPVTSTGSMKVVTAARAEPLKGDAAPIKERLRSGALDTALNTTAILREAWEDFRASDRFFKYKALIIALWVALTVVSFAVAGSGLSFGPHNDLGAKLVIAGEPDSPIYMVSNEGKAPWTQVSVLVNGKYTRKVSRVAPEGRIVFAPKELSGPHHRPAPKSLRVQSMELRTKDGDTTLMEDGQKL